MKLKYKLLLSSILAISLLGCGEDNTSSANNNDNVKPSDPVPATKATIVSKDIAVFGDIAKDKFSEVKLQDGTNVLVLDDSEIDASYAAMGLKLPKLESQKTLNIVSDNKAAEYNFATVASNNGQKNSLLRSQVNNHIEVIQKALKDQGANVNILVDQTTINSQSAVVLVTFSVDLGSNVQSANEIRNFVLSTMNNGVLPKGIKEDNSEVGNKIYLDLTFWQDQEKIFVWTGARLAEDSEAVSQKYNDLKTAAALTSSRLVATKNNNEDFKQVSGNAGGVDILWSIDASGSMSEEQNNLASGAEQFFNTLQTAGVDYRLAVNTQGYDARSYNCSTLRETTDGEKFINSATVNGLEKWRFLASPGTNDSGTETGFYCAREVDLTGFDRPEAKNLVVFVSDEAENETFSRVRPAAAEYGYERRDFSDYKQHFTSTGATYFAITGTGSMVRPTFDDYVNTYDDANFYCNGEGGRAEGGAHFKAIAQATGGSSASICSSAADWSEMFDQILETATGLASNFKLKYAPIPSLTTITVDGKKVLRDPSHQDGFDINYGQKEASIIFYGASLPKQGSVIKVKYDYIAN